MPPKQLHRREDYEPESSTNPPLDATGVRNLLERPAPKRRSTRSISPPRKRHRVAPAGMMTPENGSTSRASDGPTLMLGSRRGPTEDPAVRERRNRELREALSKRAHGSVIHDMPRAEPAPSGSLSAVRDEDGPRSDPSIPYPVTPITPEGVGRMRPANPMTPEQKLERSKRKAALINEAWRLDESPKEGNEPPIRAPVFDAPPRDPAFDAPPIRGPVFDAPPIRDPVFDAPPIDAPVFDAPPTQGPPDTPSGSPTNSSSDSISSFTGSFAGSSSGNKANRDMFPPLLKSKDGLVFISYELGLQKLMNMKNLSWAVQYEIARFRTIHSDYCFAVEEYESIFPELSGTNIEARKVPNQVRALLKARRCDGEPHSTNIAYLDELKAFVADAERKLHDPLDELDREELSLQQGSHVGLGLVYPNDNWYGGQVVQTARLIDFKFFGNSKAAGTTEFNHRYTLKLEKPQLGRSHRVSRFYGSRRVLQVSIQEKTINSPENKLREFFSQSFVLNGRIFQAVFAKEKTVYMLETGDRFSVDGLPPSHLTNLGRVSLLEFIRWHNPMEYNKKQGMAKYSARFALAFSTSVPVCRVRSENIEYIDDIQAPFKASGKRPAHLVFTDGCGFMNKAVAMKIQDTLGLRIKPTAVQARFGGAKGMFLLHPDGHESMNEDLKLWIRESQLKVLHGPDNFIQDDLSQLTMDLIRTSHLKRPARLSKEVMTCLRQGRVKTNAIQNLFEEGLKAEYETLTSWEGEGAIIKLWDAICSSGSVLYARLRREAAGASRAYGFGEAHDDDPTIDNFDEDALSEPSMPWTPDLISGLPSSLEEGALAFLVSGFDPTTCRVLRQKIKSLVNIAIDRYVAKYHVGVPLSVEGFAVPDPFGILEEGEVYCRASEAWQDAGGNWRDVIEGPVLATRHPCKVASDVQKFYAVERPELRNYVDVIVFSIKGSRSPLSLLGGGDYDGDTVLLIWQPEIVDDFENSPKCLGDPPENFIEKNFAKEIETVMEFNQRVRDKPINEIEKQLQRHLLAALANTVVVGSYSIMHEKASYMWGYNDERTIRLAHMFCTCLDGSKSGLVVKPEVRKRDQADLGKYKLPEARGGSPGFSQSPTDASEIMIRPNTLDPDIIDQLHRLGKVKKGEFKNILENRDFNAPRRRDATLLEPFQNAERDAQRAGLAGIPQKLQELQSIQNVVHQSWAKHRARIQRFKFSSLPIVERQDTLRELSTEYFASLQALDCFLFSSSDVPLIAASYAYLYDLEEHNRILETSEDRNRHYKMDKGSGFAFDIAFRPLAHIKASKTGTASTIIRDFTERFVLHRASLKLL